MAQLIIDDFYPPKHLSEAKTKPFDKVIYYISVGLFFIGLLFNIFEIQYLDNTIHGMNMFWKAASLGILLAVCITILLKRKYPSIYYESSRRIGVHFGLFLASSYYFRLRQV